MTYRVRTTKTMARKTTRSLTAPFVEFGDANRWAMAYCKGAAGKSSATVVAGDGEDVVIYHGHNGLITACL